MKPNGFVVGPGAGANRDHATLVAIEVGLDIPVSRIDVKSRSAAKAAATIGAAGAALAEERGLDPAGLLYGGRSFGGRMASMAVAEGLPASGLVLLSYPLHPPGKADNLRTEHFPDLDLPCLFISGNKDPFGTPAEFEKHLAAIPGEVTMVWLDGQGHSPKNRDDEIIAAIATWLPAR